MASPQQTSFTTETRETTLGESQILQPDRPSQPVPALPRRIQELREPKKGSRKRSRSQSNESVPKVHRHRHSRRWHEEVISNLERGESFATHTAILKILRRIPELRDNVAQLVSINHVTQTYTIKYTRRRLRSFDAEVDRSYLSYDEIQSFKSKLYRLVKLMYNSGVGYNIYPQNLYLFGTTSYEWPIELFLGSVTSANLLDVSQLDWEEQKPHVCAQIDRVFAPAEILTFQQESDSLIPYAKERMDWASSVINEASIGIDAAKADLMEARAIMTEAVAIIKAACTSIEAVNTATRKIHSSVSLPQTQWENGQYAKEDGETSLKQAGVLNDRANALVQKYGEPKPRDEASTGGMTQHPSNKPEENSEMNGGKSCIDDSRAEGETATQDAMSTDDANSRADAGLGA